MPLLDLATRFFPTQLSWPIITLSVLLAAVTLGGITGRILLWLQTNCFRS
jgi:hypothetical protein